MPLPEPMVTYCQLDYWKQIMIKSGSKQFWSRKIHFKMSPVQYMPFRPGLDWLVVSKLIFSNLIRLYHHDLSLSPLIHFINYSSWVAKKLATVPHKLRWRLTHWGRVTHVCVGNLAIIGLDNGLSPGRRQAIISTNAGILLIGPWETNFSEILISINTFSFKKIHLRISSAKWRPFCLGLNVLNSCQ